MIIGDAQKRYCVVPICCRGDAFRKRSSIDRKPGPHSEHRSTTDQLGNASPLPLCGLEPDIVGGPVHKAAELGLHRHPNIDIFEAAILDFGQEQGVDAG